MRTPWKPRTASCAALLVCITEQIVRFGNLRNQLQHRVPIIIAMTKLHGIDHALGERTRKQQHRGSPRPERRRRGPALQRGGRPPQPGHGRRHPHWRVAAGNQPPYFIGAAGRRRYRHRAVAGAHHHPVPAGERAERRRQALRLRGAGQHRGCLDEDLRSQWRPLHATGSRAVFRPHPDSLRRGRHRGRPLLLPGRPQDLHRPGLLPGTAGPAGRGRRHGPSLCHRPRGGPPRTEPHRHAAAGGRSPQAHGPAQLQRPVGPTGAAGRLLCRHLGQPFAAGTPLVRCR